VSDNDYAGVAPGIRRLSARQWEGTGAPVDGTTLLGQADKGGEYTDVATGTHYYNTGDIGNPVWSSVIT
jgi:hypothetical protein